MLPDYFDFYLPTRVLYGIELVDELKDPLAEFRAMRALLVTDNTLIQLGVVARVMRGLQAAGIEVAGVFADVPPDSTITCVERCAEQGRQWQCNLVVALGGGSVMDTAKVANLLMVKGGRAADHLGAYLLGQTPLLPLIAIPTTAGTGSEVTQVALIADPGGAEKLPFAEHQFFPRIAILDPSLTESMPPALTAMTGMDALTHAIEGLLSRQAQPASDALALYVISLINQYLLRVCAFPGDLQARGAMQIAACLAGMAFSQSMVGVGHAMAHALGGVYHIPHGLANALMLPEVMALNRPGNEARLARVATALGIHLPLPVHTLGMLSDSLAHGRLKSWLKHLAPIDNRVEDVLARLAESRIRLLIRQLAALTGLPLNLQQAGVDVGFAHLNQVVDKTLADGAYLYNPRTISADQVRRTLRKVHGQRIKPQPVQLEYDAAIPPSKTVHQAAFFRDADMLYDVLGGFFRRTLAEGDMAHKLQAAKLVVQFRYEEPAAVITLDVSGDTPQVLLGDEFHGEPDVVMTMSADFAHRFWCGEENILSALAKRQVKSRGKVPKAVRLLPIIAPAHQQYRDYVRQHLH